MDICELTEPHTLPKSLFSLIIKLHTLLRFSWTGYNLCRDVCYPPYMSLIPHKVHYLREVLLPEPLIILCQMYQHNFLPHQSILIWVAGYEQLYCAIGIDPDLCPPSDPAWSRVHGHVCGHHPAAGQRLRRKERLHLQQSFRLVSLFHHRSIVGSVVECSPATRAARVRFPDDASLFENFFSRMWIMA